MKHLLVMLFLLCSIGISAQDVIVKKDGSTVVCRVVELTESEIVYKKWSDLNGSNYVMERSAASAINYQNGKKVKMSEATNLYTPNNQNDGTRQYNDRALLDIDADEHPKVTMKWNVKAGFALDRYSGGKELSFCPGYEFSIGSMFPSKKNNIVLGIDLTLFSVGAKIKEMKVSNFGIGLAPYIAYKFVLSDQCSIMPYIGPCLNCYPDSKWDQEEEEDNNLRYSFNNHHGVEYGINLGFQTFLSSKFSIDFHFKKGFGNNGSESYGPIGNTPKYIDLSPYKLVFGVGYIF